MSVFPARILLATDGSVDAELAKTTAVGLTKITGSELYVVTVFPESAYVYAYYTARRLEGVERYQRGARMVLDTQVKKIAGLGTTVVGARLRTGDVAEEVVKLADELGAGFIAVGNRGRGRIKRMLIGGVSDSVVRYAHCPVMVVPGEEAKEA
jgi:nucleotide-binding universal stress UspA family protein